MRKSPLLFCLSLSTLSLTLTSCTNFFDFGSSEGAGQDSATSSSTTAWINQSTSSETSTSQPASGSGGTSTTTAASSGPALVDSAEYTSLWTYGSDVKLSLSFKTDSHNRSVLYYVSHYGVYSSSTSSGVTTRYFDYYFPADLTLTLNGKTYTIPDVGVREKGNNTRTDFCSSDGSFNGKHLSHLKISFNETFATESASANTSIKSLFSNYSFQTSASQRDARSLFDMNKLDLKYVPRNTSADLASGFSYIGPGCYNQEIYCYNAFSKEGLMSPHANSASLTLDTGTASKTAAYEIVESIDKRFLKRHFSSSDAKGDLYKCTWSNKLGMTSANFDSASVTNPGTGDIGIEDNYSGYHPTYDLKTNDSAGASSDFSKMVNLINVVNEAADGQASQSQLEAVLDVQEFLTFSAVDVCLGNYDSFRYSYNNYYIYFIPSSGKAIYIPYDYDWSLGTEPSSSSMSSRGAYDETSGSGRSTNSNPIFAATFFKSGSLAYSKSAYQSSYSAAVQKCLDDGILTYGSYTSLVNPLLYISKTEYSSVSSYMSKKTSALNNSL